METCSKRDLYEELDRMSFESPTWRPCVTGKKREKSVGVKGSHRQEPGNLGWEMIYPRRVAVETGRNVIYRYGWLVMVIVNGDDDDDIAGLALCKLVEGFRPTSLRMAM